METKHVNITIKSAKDNEFIHLNKMLQDFKSESKSMKTIGCFWVRMPTDLYIKHNSKKVFSSFEIYHVSYEEKFIVLLYRHEFDMDKIPPNPNTCIGTNTFEYSVTKNSIKVIIASDGRMNFTSGGVLKMDDINELKNVKLVRLVHEFPRIGGLFTSKDIWSLVGIQVPYKELKKKAEKNNAMIEDMKDVKDKWITNDVRDILLENTNVKYLNSSTVYHELSGSFVF